MGILVKFEIIRGFGKESGKIRKFLENFDLVRSRDSEAALWYRYFRF